MAITAGIFVLLILIFLFAGLCVLEYFLARRESRWPGLALPVLFLVIGVLIPLANTAVLPEADGLEVFFTILTGLLLYNIPTGILLVLYAAGREKVRRRNQIDRMNIQDL